MPPILIDSSHPPRVRLKPGDVVMVHRQLRDKETKKPFMWKWLGAVVKATRVGAKVIRFGAPEGKDEVTVLLGRNAETGEGVWLIPPEEWPDGVHAFRTRLILEGRLDEAVLG